MFLLQNMQQAAGIWPGLQRQCYHMESVQCQATEGQVCAFPALCTPLNPGLFGLPPPLAPRELLKGEKAACPTTPLSRLPVQC